MRGGKSGQVAARVRDLLSQYGERDADARPDRDEAGDGFEDIGLRSPGPGVPGRPRWWQRLAAAVPIRLDPGRRAAMAVGLAVLVAAIVTGLWVLAERPRALAVSTAASPVPGAASPVGTAAARTASASASRVPGVPTSADTVGAPASSSGVLVVDVAGKVRQPGLYRLPPDSRVDDAVKAAGGALHGVDLSSLNLAAKVGDGQQILVGVVAAPGAGGAAAVASSAGAGAASGGAGGPAGPVNLNSATLDQLETLPGVGPVLGQHIVDWRVAHGRFATVDQLNDVPGIGDVKYATLRPLVSV